MEASSSRLEGDGSNAEASASKPWHSYDTVFLNAKAGMDGVDKEKVQKVVYEMSKGSRYYENEQRKEVALQERIEKFREQVSRISPSKLAEMKTVVDGRISELEASRDLSRTWMHVDLDAFYAAVEALEDESLASKPMAVGSMSMICTANYEARKFGIRAAMPGFIGCKLCPDLILIKPNFDKYTQYSELTRQVFSLYDKHFIARSLDEAYLDITEYCKERKLSPAEVAEQLRKDVYEKTKLTCSAGVAPNRLLAKVCSDIDKPNGQYVLEGGREVVMEFISALPVRKVSGIGKVTERLLKEVLCIKLCSDLIDKRYIIAALFSPKSRDFFLAVGLGIGGSEAPQEEQRKSISCERTFSPTHDESLFLKMIGELSDSLAEDMAKEDLQGRTLTLKLKTSTFEVRNRALSLQHYICSKEDIETFSVKLLKAELPLSLRLIGIRISHFKEHDPLQRTLKDFVKESRCEPVDEVKEPDVEMDSSFLSAKGSVSRAKSDTDMSESEVVSGSTDEVQWTEDHRCSCCGVKISPDFLWLRQEHEDFHLASKMQKEENSSKRAKPPLSNGRSKKKISIESYFSKA